MRKGSIMNEKLKYAYDKMNRCCVSGQSLFSAVGSDMEYEEWFRIMLDGFEEGRDYTTVVVPAKPALTPNKKYTFDKEADRCYIGDEAFVSAPVLINYKNTYYALHEAE